MYLSANHKCKLESSKAQGEKNERKGIFLPLLHFFMLSAVVQPRRLDQKNIHIKNNYVFYKYE